MKSKINMNQGKECQQKNNKKTTTSHRFADGSGDASSVRLCLPIHKVELSVLGLCPNSDGEAGGLSGLADTAVSELGDTSGAELASSPSATGSADCSYAGEPGAGTTASVRNAINTAILSAGCRLAAHLRSASLIIARTTSRGW